MINAEELPDAITSEFESAEVWSYLVRTESVGFDGSTGSMKSFLELDNWYDPLFFNRLGFAELAADPPPWAEPFNFRHYANLLWLAPNLEELELTFYPGSNDSDSSSQHDILNPHEKSFCWGLNQLSIHTATTPQQSERLAWFCNHFSGLIRLDLSSFSDYHGIARHLSLPQLRYLALIDDSEFEGDSFGPGPFKLSSLSHLDLHLLEPPQLASSPTSAANRDGTACVRAAAGGWGLPEWTFEGEDEGDGDFEDLVAMRAEAKAAGVELSGNLYRYMALHEGYNKKLVKCTVLKLRYEAGELKWMPPEGVPALEDAEASLGSRKGSRPVARRGLVFCISVLVRPPCLSPSVPQSLNTLRSIILYATRPGLFRYCVACLARVAGHRRGNEVRIEERGRLQRRTSGGAVARQSEPPG